LNTGNYYAEGDELSFQSPVNKKGSNSNLIGFSIEQLQNDKEARNSYLEN
jgi:hypothetical protein